MFFDSWIEAFANPVKVFSSRGTVFPSFKTAFFNFAVAGLLAGLIQVAFSFKLEIALIGGGVGLVAVLVSTLFSTLVYHVIQRAFGGHASYKEVYFFFSLFAVPAAVLASIPYVSFLAFFYVLYIQLQFFEIVSGLSFKRALACVLTALLLFVLLVVVVAHVLAASVSVFTGFQPIA